MQPSVQIQQQFCVQCESAIRTAVSPHHPFLSRFHTCWCGERGHRFHDSSSALLRVSVPFCSIVVSHCRVRGVVPQRWMPRLAHGQVMVHRAGHSHALLLLCFESVSMLCGWKPSVASMYTSNQLLLGTFHSHTQVPLANALYYWRECLKESVPYSPCFSPLNADGLCACGLLRAVLLMDDHDTLSQCPLSACTEYVTVRARCGGWWLWRMMIPNEMLCLASLTTMPPAVCSSLNFSSTWCLLNPVSQRCALICTYNTTNQQPHLITFFLDGVVMYMGGDWNRCHVGPALLCWARDAPWCRCCLPCPGVQGQLFHQCDWIRSASISADS